MSDTQFAFAMLVGYLLTVVIETTVMVALLSRRHPMRVRLFAGVWLTACTYPVVWLVLPGMFDDRASYLLVAETFAPVAECAIFWFAFIRRPAKQPVEIIADEWSVVPLPPQPVKRWATLRDMTAITLANLCSFGFGELLHAMNAFEPIVNMVAH